MYVFQKYWKSSYCMLEHTEKLILMHILEVTKLDKSGSVGFNRSCKIRYVLEENGKFIILRNAVERMELCKVTSLVICTLRVCP